MTAEDQFLLPPSVASFRHRPPVLESSSSSCSALGGAWCLDYIISSRVNSLFLRSRVMSLEGVPMPGTATISRMVPTCHSPTVRPCALLLSHSFLGGGMPEYGAVHLMGTQRMDWREGGSGEVVAIMPNATYSSLPGMGFHTWRASLLTPCWLHTSMKRTGCGKKRWSVLSRLLLVVVPPSLLLLLSTSSATSCSTDESPAVAK
mmetsp:Transcript_39338/g.66056  ORF Transcript_39338/g.66056 Transcript_39338/m.66056 type:complete len:204 (+) Transcript_39338:135-746(+)